MALADLRGLSNLPHKYSDTNVAALWSVLILLLLLLLLLLLMLLLLLLVLSLLLVLGQGLENSLRLASPF